MRWSGLIILMTLISVTSISAQDADNPFGPGLTPLPSPLQTAQATNKTNSRAQSLTSSETTVASGANDPFGPGGAPTPPPVDVQWISPTGKTDQAIRQKMASETKIQFINTPLPEVVQYLKHLHHVEITLPPGLEAAAKENKEYAVTLNVEGIRFDSGLDYLTQAYRLGWYVEGGMVVIDHEQEADDHMTARMYSSRGMDEASLIETIQETLEPSSWEANGGQGRLSLLSENKLVVWQNRRGHERVEAFVTNLNE